MDRLRVSRGEAAFMLGVPIAWAVLLLFHPSGEADEVYLSLQDEVTEGYVVHIGMLLFIPLMAAVIYMLLRGVEGTAALISRAALVPFVVFYSAWEVLQGIANSILVDDVKELPEGEQPTGVELRPGLRREPPRSRSRGLRLDRDPGIHRRRDRRGDCPPPKRRRAGVGARPARAVGVPDHRTPATLRAHRPGVVRRGHCDLLAKPVDGSPGAHGPACLTRSPVRIHGVGRRRLSQPTPTARR